MELLLQLIRVAHFRTRQHAIFLAANYDSETLHIWSAVVGSSLCSNITRWGSGLLAAAEGRTIWPEGHDQETDSGSHIRTSVT